MTRWSCGRRAAALLAVLALAGCGGADARGSAAADAAVPIAAALDAPVAVDAPTADAPTTDATTTDATTTDATTTSDPLAVPATRPTPGVAPSTVPPSPVPEVTSAEPATEASEFEPSEFETSEPDTSGPDTDEPDTGEIDEVSPYLSAFCPTTPRAVTVDRERQRAWLCEQGRAIHEFPFTGAVEQPDPGTYEVYAKDIVAYSTLGRGTSYMTHFVAFTRGKFQGARIAFHSVPVDEAGASLQPLDSVGDPALRGSSAGCLRLLPSDAELLWDWLSEGDEVRVIN